MKTFSMQVSVTILEKSPFDLLLFRIGRIIIIVEFMALPIFQALMVPY